MFTRSITEDITNVKVMSELHGHYEAEVNIQRY